MSQTLVKLLNAVVSGDEETARKAAENVLSTGIDPLVAVKEGLEKGISIVGEKWQKFEIYLPAVMLAADAAKAAMAVLKPSITKEKLAEMKVGTVVIGTILGDIHDIGKTLVAMMLEVAGFEVHDLGRDVSPQKFIEQAKELDADIIAISTLMSPCIISIEDVITDLKTAGDRSKYWIIIGGAATSPDRAKKISADGYGRTSSDAVRAAKILVEKGTDVKRPVICE
jgi:trimethylamine corrinoid protein